MRMTLIVHIAAGGLGLASGYIALYSAKGAPVHRKAGMVFVCTMLTMCVAGIILAAVRGVWREVNIPAGVISAYLVITALTTVRPVVRGSRWLGFGTLLVASATGLMCLTFGLEALANGGQRNGIPAFPFFLFGVIGLLGSLGDVRMMRAGAYTGGRRLARHLWRMCVALFIAAMSFFIGQADEFPSALRIMPLLALPVLAILVTMVYWLWRVRIRQSVRGIGRVSPAEAV